MMRVVSCFAGIGGFDLGAAQSGMVTVAHVEKDDNCRQLLESKWPDAVSLPNILFAGRSSLPDCDVVCGGFPCQDLSVAGARAGIAGARSGLFYELTRVTHELQPAFLVWENVPGLLSSNKGHDFLAVLTELRRIGYSGGWRTLDAQYFGLAQRRRRVFGVFARRDIGAERCAEILSLGEGVRGHSAPSREAGKAIAGTLGGSSQSGGFRTTNLDNSGAFVVGALSPGAHPGGFNGKDAYTGHLVAHTLRSEGFDASEDGTGRGTLLVCDIAPAVTGNPYGDHESRDGLLVAFSACDYKTGQFESSDLARPLTTSADRSHSAPLVATVSDVRRLTPRECERLQGFPDDWTAGFSDSCRYRMLGNAVAVPVARWLFSRMASVWL